VTGVGEPLIFVQLALKIVMKNYRDFADLILLYILLCEMLGFHCDVVEAFALLGCYAA
jgi:hypothetical protein